MEEQTLNEIDFPSPKVLNQTPVDRKQIPFSAGPEAVNRNSSLLKRWEARGLIRGRLRAEAVDHGFKTAAVQANDQINQGPFGPANVQLGDA